MPGLWAGASLASCRGVPVGRSLTGSAYICGRPRCFLSGIGAYLGLVPTESSNGGQPFAGPDHQTCRSIFAALSFKGTRPRS